MFIRLLLLVTIICLQCLFNKASASNNVVNNSEIDKLAAGARSFQKDSNENLMSKRECTMIWGVEINSCHIGGDEANRLAKEGVLIGPETMNNYLSLEGGNILLHPEKDITVETSEAKVHIGGGASIFISKDKEGLVFYDLSQMKPKQIVITVSKNGQKIVLEPGRMLVLSKNSNEDFKQLEIDCHRVGYDNVVSLKLQNSEMKAFLANFSIASAIANIEPLKETVLSSSAYDEMVTNKLVKGAVVLGGFATDISDECSSIYNNDTKTLARGQESYFAKAETNNNTVAGVDENPL